MYKKTMSIVDANYVMGLEMGISYMDLVETA